MELFQVGDKIFYPMHGAGTVKAIEEKEILGELQSYYVLNMTLSNMHVMIPAGNKSRSIVRDVVDTDTIHEALGVCYEEGVMPTVSIPQQKQRVYMSKLKSGDIYESAQLIRDLLYIEKEKKLNSHDKAILLQAQQLFISELSLVLDINQDEATYLFNNPSHNQ